MARSERETRTDRWLSIVSILSATTAAASADPDRPRASSGSRRCSASEVATASDERSVVVEELVVAVVAVSCCCRGADVNPCRQPQICIIVCEWYNIFYTRRVRHVYVCVRARVYVCE